MGTILNRYRFLFTAGLAAVLALATAVTALPGQAHAFGSLTENGTAAFMGIGVTPTKILHVSGSGPGTVPLFVRGSDSAGFIIERTSTNRWVLGVNESPTLGNGFVLSTIPTGNTSIPRLMITQGGYVGIGTVSPTRKLQVETASGEAVYGQTGDTHQAAISGKNNSNGPGVYGESASNDDGVGVLGTNTAGGNYGILGDYVYAGYFHGGVEVTGNLTRAGNTVWDDGNGCSKVASCTTCGGVKHWEWLYDISAATDDIYDNGYVKIQRISTARTFRLYCGHPSGCTYVYYLNGVRTDGTLSNTGTVDINMTANRNDVRFLFAKTATGMDMLTGDVFDTNGSYLHFICHDTKQ